VDLMIIRTTLSLVVITLTLEFDTVGRQLVRFLALFAEMGLQGRKFLSQLGTFVTKLVVLVGLVEGITLLFVSYRKLKGWKEI
jgi:hypothetical protein